MSKNPIKSFSDLLQSFFCQRLQTQQRVSSHTLASYRDTFRLGFEFIRQKTGRTASQQLLTDWNAPNVIAFWITWKECEAVSHARATCDWRPFALS